MIPYNTKEWPQWSRIPVFWEQKHQIANHYWDDVASDLSVERRTVLDGAAYLVRGGGDRTCIYRYLDRKEGTYIVLRIFSLERNVFEVMEELPVLLVKLALE